MTADNPPFVKCPDCAGTGSENGVTGKGECSTCGGSGRIADHLDPPPATPRCFVLVRDEDVTGVSGTGVVAEGIEFTGGVVALRWLSEWPTSVVFHERGLESVEAVHGHGGRTRVEWLGG